MLPPYLIEVTTVLGLLAVVWFFFLRERGPVRQLFPVEGTVTLADGRPLSGGELYFFEIDPSSGQQGVIARCPVQLDGTFRVLTGEQAGMPEGRYKVVITAPQPPDRERPPAVWPPYNRRYARYGDTPLEYAVTAGTNFYPIKLTP
jgi:hypothetical protein